MHWPLTDLYGDGNRLGYLTPFQVHTDSHTLFHLQTLNNGIKQRTSLHNYTNYRHTIDKSSVGCIHQVRANTLSCVKITRMYTHPRDVPKWDVECCLDNVSRPVVHQQTLNNDQETKIAFFYRSQARSNSRRRSTDLVSSA